MSKSLYDIEYQNIPGMRPSVCQINENSNSSAIFTSIINTSNNYNLKYPAITDPTVIQIINANPNVMNAIGTNINIGSIINTMDIDTNNNILYIGGTFTTIQINGSSVVQNNIAAYDITNNIFLSIPAFGTNINTTYGITGTTNEPTSFTSPVVRKIIFDNINNLLYICGNFSNVSSSNGSYAYKSLAIFGTKSNTHNSYNWLNISSLTNPISLNATIYAIALYRNSYNNTLYIGGTFTVIGGNGQKNFSSISFTGVDTSNMIGKWNIITNGLTLNSLITTAYCYTLLLNDTTLYIGGTFDSAGNIAQSNITSYNIITDIWDSVSKWKDTNNKVGLRMYVNSTNTFSTSVASCNALLLYNNNLYIGGKFTNAGDKTQMCIAQYNILTNKWIYNSEFNYLVLNSSNTLSSGTISQIIYNISIDTTYNLLYLGGSFTNNNNGTTNSNFCIYNLSTNLFLKNDLSFSSNIFNILMSSDKLYICGQFTNISKQTVSPGIVSLNLKNATFVNNIDNSKLQLITGTGFGNTFYYNNNTWNNSSIR